MASTAPAPPTKDASGALGPSAVFICYRREDSSNAVGQMYGRLTQRFGKDQVFMDLDGGSPGIDFRGYIDDVVAQCDTLIAVIGQQWLAKDSAGQRRIDEPQDAVRLEIACALRRRIRIIPVLVDGASMPGREELPAELKTLVMRNGFELRPQRFSADVGRLLDELERAPRLTPRPPGVTPSPSAVTPKPASVTPKPAAITPAESSAKRAAAALPAQPRTEPLSNATPTALATVEAVETPVPLAIQTPPSVPTALAPVAAVETLLPLAIQTPPSVPAASVPAAAVETALAIQALSAPEAEGAIADIAAPSAGISPVPPVEAEPAPILAAGSYEALAAAAPELAATVGTQSEPAIGPAAPAAFAAEAQIPAQNPAMLPSSTAPRIVSHRLPFPGDSLPRVPDQTRPPWPRQWPLLLGGLLVCGVVATIASRGGSRGNPRGAVTKPAASSFEMHTETTTGVSSAAHAQSAVPSPEVPRAAPMVQIPAGQYTMGSNEGDPDERPAHRVDVVAYAMDQTEVTVSAYRACVVAGQCEARTTVFGDWYKNNGGVEAWSRACNWGQSERDDHPMNCVDWGDAEKYCHWAGKRLPTEEEWEYAARGNEGRKYPWGSDAPTAQRLNACGPECFAWLKEQVNETRASRQTEADPWSTTAPVGSFTGSSGPFGHLDLAGNVWEWTENRYCSYKQPGCNGTARSFRGGSWTDDNPTYQRASFRNNAPPEFRASNLGFRCAR